MTKIIRITDHADNTGSPLVVFIRWISAYPFPSVACPPRRVIRGPLLLPIGRGGYLNRLLTETYDSHGCLSISWFESLCDSHGCFVYFAVQIFRQNEPNAQNREKGISEIEGKGAMGSAEQHGSRASFN